MKQVALEFVGEHFYTLWAVSLTTLGLGVLLLVIGLIRRRQAS